VRHEPQQSAAPDSPARWGSRCSPQPTLLSIWFSPRLCASPRTSGFLPDETPFSRRAAEARRNTGPSASGVSPCLPASVRATGCQRRVKPGSLAKPPRRQEGLSNRVSSRLRGFARVRVSFRGIEATFSRRHGGTGKAKNSVHPVFSAPPRLRENIGFSSGRNPILSQSRGGAEECRAIRVSGFFHTPVPP
jgi:hypothetical protein